LDPIPLASLKHLARRMRRASSKYADVRCVINHKTDIGLGDFSEEYGDTFGMCGFTPGAKRHLGSWLLFYYSAYERERFKLRHFLVEMKKAEPWETSKEQDDQRERLRLDAECLFNDAFWLVRSIGLDRIPGLNGIDTSEFYGSAHVWLWLLFHAAWSRPAGTILRASQFIPVGVFLRKFARAREEEAVGFPPGAKKTPSDYTTARKAVAERKRSLGRAERVAELDGAAYEAEQHSMRLLKEGAYVSELPMDPFTASAALLDLIAADSIQAKVIPPPSPLPVVVNGKGKPVFVLGKEQPPLTDAQYEVIETLLAAGENGLNKDELPVKSKHGDAVRMLSRIRKLHCDWAEVIRLAGKTGGRYRILHLHQSQP
jgi:hypothetical protein